MTLNKILAFDAVTCALMGVALASSAPFLSTLLALPESLLFYAGWLLFPVAILMAVLSRQDRPWEAGVWLVIIGNGAWIALSLFVLAVTSPNLLGYGFLLVQALVVGLLAAAEYNAAPRRRAGIA